MTTSDEAQNHKRTVPKTIRFSPAELEKIAPAAKAAGYNFSDYIRHLSLDAKPVRKRRSPTVDAELLQHALALMGKIGSNVNQLARQANRGRIPDSHELRSACESVAEIRIAILLSLGYDVAVDGEDDGDPPS